MTRHNLLHRSGLLLVLVITLLMAAPLAQAQLGGEDIPEGVTHDEVYAVASEMYCDVCAGVPLSACASVTCRAWRQEIANLLGEGWTHDEIYTYFAERYGADVTGVPLQDNERGLAVGLPLILTLVLGVIVVWQVWRIQQHNDTRAHQAARAAGLDENYSRPVPNNVDQDGLRSFLDLLEAKK